ncbi:hypothetical protein WA158_008163 [Blastocystis sp. Blastoise]
MDKSNNTIPIETPVEEIKEQSVQEVESKPMNINEENDDKIRDQEEEDSQEPVKVFVGQVPHSFNEDDLKKEFEQFGTILRTQIIKDRVTGFHRGCGFVTFAKRSSALEAIEKCHQKKYFSGMKYPMQVKEALNDGRIAASPMVSVQFLPSTYIESDIQSLFGKCGDIVEINLNPPNEKHKVIYVEFSTKEQAINAVNTFNGFVQDKELPPLVVKQILKTEKKRNFGADQENNFNSMSAPARSYTPFVDPYYNYPYPNIYNTSPNVMGTLGTVNQELQAIGEDQLGSHREGPPGANLFVYHLPQRLNDNDLATLFFAFGTIYSAKVFIDKQSGESKGFGFVSFSSTQEAEAAIANMNGFQIGTKRLKVQHKKEKRMNPGLQHPVMPINAPNPMFSSPYLSPSSLPLSLPQYIQNAQPNIMPNMPNMPPNTGNTMFMNSPYMYNPSSQPLSTTNNTNAPINTNNNNINNNNNNNNQQEGNKNQFMENKEYIKTFRN